MSQILQYDIFSVYTTERNAMKCLLCKKDWESTALKICYQCFHENDLDEITMLIRINASQKEGKVYGA